MSNDGKVCLFAGCDRLTTRHTAKGYCGLHYKRLLKHGDPSIKLKRAKILTTGECSVNGCDRDILQKRFCRSHYMKWWRHGDPLFSMPPARGRTPTVQSWQAMKRRCTDPKVSGYERYGGRGITYDPKWETYEGFVEDMGERPEGTTIDRIDNDGNYEKSNCRWATTAEQMSNISTNRRVKIGGEILTISQASRKYDIGVSTIAARLDRGWSNEDAVTKPKLR